MDQDWYIKQMNEGQMIVRCFLDFGHGGHTPAVHIDLATARISGDTDHVWGGVTLWQPNYTGELAALQVEIFPALQSQEDCWLATLKRWRIASPQYESAWQRKELAVCLTTSAYSLEPIEPAHRYVLQYMCAIQGILYANTLRPKDTAEFALCSALVHRIGGFIHTQNRFLNRLG